MVSTFPRLSRREFIKVNGVGIAGYSLLPMLRPRHVQAKETVNPRGGAEVCILIMLQGAPSQMDTFDIKENSDTPEDFNIQTIKPGLRMPVGTLPRLSKCTDKFAIVRSMEFWENCHNLGVYYLQAGRPFSPARVNEVPSVGAVIAYESLKNRKESDFLPPYISLNLRTDYLVANGLLPPSCAPMGFNARKPPPFALPESERETFEIRRSLLGRMERRWQPEGNKRSHIFADLDDFTRTAGRLSDPKASAIFSIQPEDDNRYGKIDYKFNQLGNACVMARNLVEADAGAKFVIINHGTWDLHSNIYDKSKSLNQYTLNNELDLCLSNLIEDLEQRTDPQGRRLIDKTIIACVGEFGRTPGELNGNKGRDHWSKAGFAVFAGAGVKGGTVLGATDDTASKVIDPGWHKDRSIYPEDVLATIYSVMGIDWTKKITETPSGRHFEYTESISPKGYMDFGEISELFV